MRNFYQFVNNHCAFYVQTHEKWRFALVKPHKRRFFYCAKRRNIEQILMQKRQKTRENRLFRSKKPPAQVRANPQAFIRRNPRQSALNVAVKQGPRIDLTAPHVYKLTPQQTALIMIIR